MADFSVIIRCRNEEQWIGHAIQSVLDYTISPEIIVIDNHSTDGSMEVVRMFEKFWNVKRLDIDQYTPGKALNLGVSAVSYPLILVLSAHCVITGLDAQVVQWLETHAAVFGSQTPIYKGKRLLKRYVWSHFVDEPVENMWSESENRHFLHNAFAFYNKDYLLQYPFDEKLYSKEERYWAGDTIKRGGKILYQPRLKCDHHWTPLGKTWTGIG